MRRSLPDLTELRDALRADVGGLAEALLGPPNKAVSTKSTWRWGSKGSLSLEVHGPHKGFWYSHEGSEGGDPLSLIRTVRGGTFPDALAYARRWTGIPGEADDASDDEDQDERQAQIEADRQARREEREAVAAAERVADHATRIATAQQIAAGTVSLAGTLGEYYLKQERGIPPPAAGWPDAFRFHPRNRSLVAIATAADGTVHAVQQVYLTEEGAKAPDAPGRPTKRTNGVTKNGAMVRLPGAAAGALLLTEGPETGLAAWSSSGHETWVALGGIPKLAPGTGRRVVICRDDDQRYSPADRKLLSTIAEWRRAGVVVAVATPWRSRRYDRSDLADTILAEGPEAVQRRIAAAVEPSAAPVARLPVAEARKVAGDVIGAFFAKVGEQLAEPPDEGSAFAHAVRVDVGVGKSHAAREHAAELLARMREQGDKRGLVIAVPTHKLGDEQARLFEALPAARAAGLTAAVWRGRSAPNPASPDFNDDTVPPSGKATMCGDLERVRDAQSVALDVQTAACRRKVKLDGEKKEWALCPFFDGCAYQAQRKRKADLWIVPHELLFTSTPSALGEVAAVIVDEAAWQDGLVGVHGRDMALSLDTLRQRDVIVFNRLPDHTATDRLHYLRTRLLDVLMALPDGPVHRKAMLAGAVTADAAAEAVKLEWQRKVDPLMHPGMTKERRRQAIKAAEGNKSIAALAMAWDAFRALLAPGGPDASGWLALATIESPDGPVRVLHLKGRKRVREGWEVPTLLMDALLPLDLVQHYWPAAELIADVRAEAPHQVIRQVGDRAFSKAMLEPLGEDEAARNPEEARRRGRNLRDLRAVLVREARRYAPGKVLIVAQKAVRVALEATGPLPGNVELAHHNAVSGRDEWRDVRALIAVGRTLPSPASVERIAEALTGRASSALGSRYERVDAAREMVDGSTVATEADRHPDSVAEAVRWQVCEGELLQIIGRARGVNRSAADPVDVLLLTDVPLPVPMHELIEAASLDPNLIDLMLSGGGMVLENPTDAAAAYPHLWGTRNAAKLAFKRGKLGSFPYIEFLIGVRPQLRQIDYKPAGQGKQASVAGFDPSLCPDPVAFLTERLGPLAWFKVEDEPPPDDPGEGSGKPPCMADAGLPLGVELVAHSPTPLPTAEKPPVRPPPASVIWSPSIEERDTGPPAALGSAVPAIEATWGGAGDG